MKIERPDRRAANARRPSSMIATGIADHAALSFTHYRSPPCGVLRASIATITSASVIRRIWLILMPA